MNDGSKCLKCGDIQGACRLGEVQGVERSMERSGHWSMQMKGKVFDQAMVYISETWAMKKNEENVIRRAKRVMERIMCGERLRDRERSSELMSMAAWNQESIADSGTG